MGGVLILVGVGSVDVDVFILINIVDKVFIYVWRKKWYNKSYLLKLKIMVSFWFVFIFFLL